MVHPFSLDLVQPSLIKIWRVINKDMALKMAPFLPLSAIIPPHPLKKTIPLPFSSHPARAPRGVLMCRSAVRGRADWSLRGVAGPHHRGGPLHGNTRADVLLHSPNAGRLTSVRSPQICPAFSCAVRHIRTSHGVQWCEVYSAQWLLLVIHKSSLSFFFSLYPKHDALNVFENLTCNLTQCMSLDESPSTDRQTIIMWGRFLLANKRPSSSGAAFH